MERISNSDKLIDEINEDLANMTKILKELQLQISVTNPIHAGKKLLVIAKEFLSLNNWGDSHCLSSRIREFSSLQSEVEIANKVIDDVIKKAASNPTDENVDALVKNVKSIVAWEIKLKEMIVIFHKRLNFMIQEADCDDSCKKDIHADQMAVFLMNEIKSLSIERLFDPRQHCNECISDQIKRRGFAIRFHNSTCQITELAIMFNGEIKTIEFDPNDDDDVIGGTLFPVIKVSLLGITS